MRKSARLRLRDVRKVYHLISECRELGSDPQSWYRHLLAGAALLIGASVATGGQVVGWSLGEPRPLLLLDMGWEESQTHEMFQRWVREGNLRSDLLYSRLCELKGRIRTRYRRQVIEDEEWYSTLFYCEYRKFGRIDDCLCSVCTLPDGDLIQSIALHRAPESEPFGEWERRVLHWLHHELAPLVGQQLVTARDSVLWKLPRHLRRTLDCLFQGDSEKKVALRLKLSAHTIHDYVKEIYRHFGVSSRAELLTRRIK